MSRVRRIYAEKRPGYDVAARQLCQELREALAALPQQTSNATLMEAIQQNLNDIQWLILVATPIPSNP